jgi:hypothetical protein
MSKNLITIAAVLAFASAGAAAQAPEQNAPKAQESVQPNIPRPVAQLVNVKLDLTITDQRGAAAAATKTVSMVLADRGNGRIRTQGEFRPQSGPHAGRALSTTLNVDAQPEVTRDNRVKMTIVIEYKPQVPDGEDSSASISESMTVILEDGKPLVVSQSADPHSDRKVKIEAKATFLK